MNRFFYSLLLYLVLPFVPLKLLWRGIKQPEYRQHWRERFGIYHLALNGKPIIWLHSVSVGETRAAAPLIHALIKQYPNHQLLLTHTTPTGRATSEQLFGDSVLRVYLPYDLPFAVKGFLNHFKPKLGMLMETELWFNLIEACHVQNIPLLLINARLSEKSASGYAKLSKLVSEGLSHLSAIAAQTESDAARLTLLGASNVSVTGNLKFDVQAPENTTLLGQQLRDLLGANRPVLLAASTRENEEVLILEAISQTDIQNLLTVIVPRHPQRFNEVATLLEKNNLSFVRRSALKDNSSLSLDIHYVLGDSMGEMFTYYAACDVAFIGGSLLPLGGQNLIEAASLGKPVLIGPHTFNFADATRNGIAAGAVIQVQTTAELSEKIAYLFNHKTEREHMGAAGMQFSQASVGATDKVIKLIAENLH